MANVRRSSARTGRASGARGKAAKKTRATSPYPIAGQIAVRWMPGAERRAVSSLMPLGRIEKHATSRVLVLHHHAPVSRVRRVLGRLVAGGVIDFVTPVLCEPSTGARQIPTDEIVVRLKSTEHASRTIKSLSDAHGLRGVRRNEFDPAQYIVKVSSSSGQAAIRIARSLDRCDDVEFASPNVLTRVKR